VLHDVGDPADVTGDHRDTVAHRLEQYDAESFRITARVEYRREHEDV